jgi:hypothetical protein
LNFLTECETPLRCSLPPVIAQWFAGSTVTN